MEPHEVLMKEIEGFAGIYLDEQQVLTILIVPTSEEFLQPESFEPKAIQLSVDEMKRIKGLMAEFYPSTIYGNQLNFRTAKHSLAELFDWQSRIQVVIASQAGFVGIALAEDINKVVVWTLEKKYENALRAKLEQNGIPEDVMMFEETGELISR